MAGTLCLPALRRAAGSGSENEHHRLVSGVAPHEHTIRLVPAEQGFKQKVSMKRNLLIIAAALAVTCTLSAQTDSTPSRLLSGEWFVEAMREDTVVLNRDQVALRESADEVLTVRITFYDDLFHRIDRVAFDKQLYEEAASAHVEEHAFDGTTLRLGAFFGAATYRIHGQNDRRVVLSKEND
ncbi:MAG: hypothetical protein RLY31_2988 [Bacteroidota bacterium]|jgi:hypothetical protein